MKEFALYTVARIGLFVASYALVVGVYLLVTGSDSVPVLWPFLAAVLISAVASLYLLKGLRARFAAVVERRAAAASRRFEQMRAKEDEPEGDPAVGQPGEPGAERGAGDEAGPGPGTGAEGGVDKRADRSRESA